MADHHGTKYSKAETEHYADVNGHQIHYNDVGEGPAFFCFHGGGPGANAWDNTKHNLDALAEHFRCIIMDMPGYGLSDKDVKRGDEPLDIFCAKIVLGLMDQLGIERGHLYGSSQFSPCCVRFGIEYPDRVGKIVIQASGVARGPSYFSPGQTFGGKMLGVVAQSPTRENMATLMHEFIPNEELCTDEAIDARLAAALIHPDGLRNQIEGNVIHATSRTLLEELRFDQTAVTSLDWISYPILPFPRVPAVEIALINRPDARPSGAGEPASAPVAAAIGNAIFDATGVRLQQVPFTPNRVREALTRMG